LYFSISSDRRAVTEFVKKCCRCQRIGSDLIRSVNKLPEERASPLVPYEKIVMDFLSIGDKRKLIVIVDEFSGHVTIYPAYNETVAESLAAIELCRDERGQIKFVKTDAASIFKSDKFREGLAKLGIQHEMAPPRGHFVVGKAERVNGLILRTLRALCSYVDVSKWPDTLSHQFYCLTKKISNIINQRPVASDCNDIITPELLVTGRRGPMVSGFSHALDRRLIVRFQQKFAQLHFQSLRQKVRATLKNAMKKEIEYHIGDRVLYSHKITKTDSNRTGVVTDISGNKITLRDSISNKFVKLHQYQLMPLELLE
jgi:transposase InsO family protein